MSDFNFTVQSNGYSLNQRGSPTTNSRYGEGTANKMEQLVVNILVSRAQLLQQMTDPRRDLDQACGWPKQPTAELYWELYRRSPIAAQANDLLATECWSVQPIIRESPNPSKPTQFDKDWTNLPRQLRGEQSWYKDPEGSVIYDYLLRAQKLAGLGRYGVIFVGIDDGLPYHMPAYMLKRPRSETPLRTSSGVTPIYGGGASADITQRMLGMTWLLPGSGGLILPLGMESSTPKKQARLLFLRVFPEALAQVVQVETDTTSPRYGQPLYYKVFFTEPLADGLMTGDFTAGTLVHWSRVVHIPSDGLGTSDTFASPRLETLLNDILDLRKIYGVSAEAYWLACFATKFLKTQPQLAGDVPANMDTIRKMMEDIENDTQRWGFLRGLDVVTVPPSIVDPTPHINAHIQAICIKMDCPMRIFMGSERGQLASGQDSDEWDGTKKASRRNYSTPRAIVPLVDRFIALTILSEPDGYTADWQDQGGKSDSEKATIAGQLTTAVTEFATKDGLAMMSAKDFWTTIIGLDEDKADAIIEGQRESEEERQVIEMQHQQDMIDNGLAPDPNAPPPPPPGAQGGSPQGGPGGKPPAPTPGTPSVGATNAFCPTGEGGGVDPSCSPGGHGSPISSSPRGRLGRALDTIKAIPGAAHRLELSVKHYLKDEGAKALAALPFGVQEAVHAGLHAAQATTGAAFASWRIGQLAVEEVGREKGMSPDGAKKLRGVMSALDIATFKPISIGLAATGVSAATVGATSFIPPASAAYLAYSSVRHPLASYRAAKNIVTGKAFRHDDSHTQSDSSTGTKRPAPTTKLGVEELIRHAAPGDEDPGLEEALVPTRMVADAIEAHDDVDWYFALLMAALEDTQDLREAIPLADEAYDAEPEDPSDQEAADDEEDAEALWPGVTEGSK